MLYRLQTLLGLPIAASDGEIGKITDIYFDDHCWTLRYLVVDTGNWLSGRKVLISAVPVNSIDWDRNQVHVALTKKQVAASPNIDTDKPVSRQHESDFLDYYGYPYYWTGPLLWGAAAHSISPVGPIPPAANAPDRQVQAPTDPHLRSAKEVTGYRLETTTDSIGHVADFLLDNASWAIRYLVVDTRNWLPGKHVLIPPQWVNSVDWMEHVVNIDVTRDTVQAAPEYHTAKEFSRKHETNLYKHYQRPGYWQ